MFLDGSLHEVLGSCWEWCLADSASTDLICFYSWAEGLQDAPESPHFHVSTSERLSHNLSNLASIDGKGKYLWVICTTNIQVSTKHEPKLPETERYHHCNIHWGWMCLINPSGLEGYELCITDGAKIYKQGRNIRIPNQYCNNSWWITLYTVWVRMFTHPLGLRVIQLGI